MYLKLSVCLHVFELDIEMRLVPNVVGYHEKYNISLC